VNQLTNGVLNPAEPFLGPLKDGGTIIANVAPGGWGAMTSPAVRGSQEVTVPVHIEGAEVGDAIVVEIRSIDVTSHAATSGTAKEEMERFIGDALLKVKCPGCGKLHPTTKIEGIGKEAVKCTTCQTSAAPLTIEHGYTAVFHERENIALTLNKDGARKVALDAEKMGRLPNESLQHPSPTFAASDLSGVLARIRPFIGELGTVPSKAMPASYNARDAERKLLEAQHEFYLTKEDLTEHCTDGHLQVNTLRQGSIILCPVKVDGAGVYLGDIRMMQGAGNPARQTVSVAGIVQLRVSVAKKLNLCGPVILPNCEDLPHLAQPFTRDERKAGRDLAEDFGVKQIEEAFPLTIIGTGANLNDAVTTAVGRAATLLELEADEIKNRATIAGDISIVRMPGVVTLTAQFPKSVLKKAKLFKWVKKQYDK
jgi:formamidase